MCHRDHKAQTVGNTEMIAVMNSGRVSMAAVESEKPWGGCHRWAATQLGDFSPTISRNLPTIKV